MPENTPKQQVPIPGDYPLRQSLLRPIQHQLAKQGVDVSPEEALQLLEQKNEHDAKRWQQQELAKQGIDVSPEEAPNLLTLRMLHAFDLQYQQELAEQGIDVS